jgi:hypothetical protein
VEANLRAIAAEVHRRAPQARLVFVDYVTVLPPAGSCPALGFGEAAAQDMRGRATRLAALTAKVAKETGADLIEASRLTRGHDACAKAPWIWGAPQPGVTSVPFHPRPEAIDAVAQAVIAQLQR